MTKFLTDDLKKDKVNFLNKITESLKSLKENNTNSKKENLSFKIDDLLKNNSFKTSNALNKL